MRGIVMCEIEQLAAIMREFPCLWDVAHEDYHNRDVKDGAWNEVFKRTYPKWGSMDELHQKSLGADLKKKWTNVRDCYRKDLQKLKYASVRPPSKRHKRYVHSDALSFLAPVFVIRKNSNEKLVKSPDESQNESEYNIEAVYNVEDNDNAYDQSDEQSTSGETNSRTKESKEDISEQILELQQTRTPITPIKISTNEDDDDTNFLLSFRSDMKRMNVKEKLDFKIGVLQLVKKIVEDGPSTRSNL